jgi:L-ribulose-5-phosphate 3-epimerase UlaE
MISIRNHGHIIYKELTLKIKKIAKIHIDNTHRKTNKNPDVYALAYNNSLQL